MLTVLRHVYATEGVRTLFSGIVPRVIWISMGGAVFFGAYETFKRAYLRNVAHVDADDR
jgi:solute carrier family 25 S-adenosylmethionine transporter 26